MMTGNLGKQRAETDCIEDLNPPSTRRVADDHVNGLKLTAEVRSGVDSVFIYAQNDRLDSCSRIISVVGQVLPRQLRR